MPTLRASEMNRDDLYRLLIGVIVPRPIGWFTTVDPDTGIVNLAPFSFFTACSVKPPMICFAADSRGGEHKDTVRNIRRTREYVANVVTEELARQMVYTSGEFPRHISEVEAAGLSLIPSEAVSVPRVKESPIHMECRLHTILELGEAPHSLVIGEILLFHIDPRVYDNGRINHDELKALGRMAGDGYTTTRDRLSIPRPDAAEVRRVVAAREGKA